MKKFEIKDHEPSYLPDGEWKLVWADEFDGTELDVDEYHTFGMLWEESGYTFFVDGKEDGHADAPVSHIPQFILISTEVNGYRSKLRGAAEDAKKAVGDVFTVDYVRVFDRV